MRDEPSGSVMSEPTSGYCVPTARRYSGEINCDQVSWLESTLRRTVNAMAGISQNLNGKSFDIVKDAIIESAILEIAETLNLEVDRTNIRTRR